MLIKRKLGITAHTSTEQLSFHGNVFDQSVWHPLPLGCLWFTDNVQQLNLLQILVESVLTTIFRVADSSTSCWLRDLIRQKQNKAPFISLHTMSSCNFGRTGAIMRLLLELHWNFLKNRLRILVGLCIISFEKTDRQVERERESEVRSDQFDCFSVAFNVLHLICQCLLW